MKVITEIPDVNEYMKELVRQAYEEGMKDARERSALPYVLTQADLEGIFQIGRTSVEKITSRADFPRFDHLKARYPRDRVFDWIDRNTTLLIKYREQG